MVDAGLPAPESGNVFRTVLSQCFSPAITLCAARADCWCLCRSDVNSLMSQDDFYGSAAEMEACVRDRNGFLATDEEEMEGRVDELVPVALGDFLGFFCLREN